jgi:hypothetical protein
MRPLRPGHLLTAAIAAAAATGILAGLARLGLGVAWGPPHAGDHGPLLVLGVFATVVAQERAAVLGTAWGLAAPLGTAAAATALLIGAPGGPWIATAANVALIATNGAIARRRPTRTSWLLLAGSALLLLGTARWAAGDPVARVVPAWTGFFVLTITAERSRLSRRAVPGVWPWRVLDALVALFVAAIVARLFGVRAAGPVMGLAMAGVAAWQTRYDIAGGSADGAADGAPLPRYMAAGVRAGTFWLLAGGALLAWLDPPAGGPAYDAVLHAVFVGFVLSTGFAHAPGAVTTLAGRPVPFSPLFYAPLALLQASLMVRLAGDLAGDLPWRRAGGIGNAVAIALFAIVLIGAMLSARRRPATPS